MKTPNYWDKKNLIARLLFPLGKLYAFATSLRIILNKAKKCSKPVICIGNLTAGGTGKTPVAISIAKILQNAGYNPFFISRGYGGKLQDVIVNKQHSPTEVGDEPLLLSRQAKVAINSNRYLAANKAIDNGANIIIMDDGYQNPILAKDFSLLVFDGGFGIGNGYCIPAGPLREDFKQGLKRANAVLIIGKDEHNLAKQINNIPIFYGKVTAIKPNTANKRAIAFAGIGRPQKFYNSLCELGFQLIETIDFPDHHYYNEAELEKIIQKSQEQNCEIFTTSKDLVKIPHKLQKHFQVLEITIEFDNNELKDLLLNTIK